VFLHFLNVCWKDFGRLLAPVEQYVNEIRNEDLIDRAPAMNVPVDSTVCLFLSILFFFFLLSFILLVGLHGC
jgi:hypothetical protein